MTLAIILIIAAAVALVFIFTISVTRTLQVSRSSNPEGQIQPLDLVAFRNLISSAETDYLRQRLPAREFRQVQKERLRATAAYVQTAAQNAAILIQIGQLAQASADPRAVAAGRQLADNAVLLRRNATYALFRIYVALAWPASSATGDAILDGYQQLSTSAMLLGRLQNPASPVRISSTT
jgi:hypothetical protein